MAEIDHFDISELWTVEATFKVGGVPTDPGQVTATLQKPDGTLVPYAAGALEITNPSVGVYVIADVGDQAGQHWLDVVGTSPAAGRQRFSFVVDARFPSDLLEDYALTSIENVELMIDKVGQQGSVSHEEDDKRWIAELINVFSKLVNDYLERELLPTADGLTRTFQYDGDGVLSLAPYEARTISAVVVYSNLPAINQVALTEGYTDTGYSWYGVPRDKTPEGTFLQIEIPRRSRWHRDTWVDVTVTGDWGSGIVPRTVRHVVEAEIANAYWNSRRRVPTNLEEASYLAVRELDYALDSTAEKMLDPHANRTLVP